MDTYTWGQEILRIRNLLANGDTREIYECLDYLLEHVETETGRTIELPEDED